MSIITTPHPTPPLPSSHRAVLPLRLLEERLLRGGAVGRGEYRLLLLLRRHHNPSLQRSHTHTHKHLPGQDADTSGWGAWLISVDLCTLLERLLARPPAVSYRLSRCEDSMFARCTAVINVRATLQAGRYTHIT